MKKIGFLLQEQFGKLPEQAYTAADMERIRYYHDTHKEADDDAFTVDETTWNDLDMDAVFALLNATQSSVGEDYLYHFLHCMDLKGDDRFKNLTDYFCEQGEERLQTQISLHGLGKITTFSIAKIIDLADDLLPEKNAKHIIMDLCLLASIALIFVYPAFGVLLTLICLSVNIFSYFKKKSEIAPYFTTFFYIKRMLGAAKEILKINHAAFHDDEAEIMEILKKSRRFARNTFFLAGGTQFSSNIFDILFDYLRILFHLDIIKFNSMLGYLLENRAEIEALRAFLGRIDAAIACASTRKALPGLCRPDFTTQKMLHVQNAFHPLLNDPVRNSIEARHGILITGSNASGKSTFIKSIAICALLAQTIGLVPADSYRAARFRLLTSMALTDHIREGESYFIVEIRSLKRIVDQAKEDGAPVLCFVDEVLRGTNTVERIAASSQILSSLNRLNAICFAASHDIELTNILQNEFRNVHFEETVTDNDVEFNYRLTEGPSTTRNAIRLLKVIGFDDAVINRAEEAAQEFTRSNQWSVIS